jgi:hypothetical protein
VRLAPAQHPLAPVLPAAPLLAAAPVRTGAAVRAPLPALLRAARQGEREGAPLTQLAGHRQLATHAPRQVAADGQAEPHPLVTAAEAPVHLHEGLEDGVQHVGRDADAGVAHVHVHLAALPLARHAHGAVGIGELHRVGEQVDEHLHQLGPVGADGERGVAGEHRERDPLPLGLWRDHRLDLAQQGADRHVGEVELHAAGLEAGMVQYVVDETHEVVLRRLDAGQRGALLLAPRPVDAELEELRVALDGGERGAQLVAHHGQELGLGQVGRLHRAEGRLRRLARLVLQRQRLLARRLHHLLRRHVAEVDAEPAGQGIVRRAHPALDARQSRVEGDRLSLGQRPQRPGVGRAVAGPREEFPDHVTEHRVARPLEQRGGGLVDVDVSPAAVQHHDTVVELVEQQEPPVVVGGVAGGCVWGRGWGNRVHPQFGRAAASIMAVAGDETSGAPRRRGSASAWLGMAGVVPCGGRGRWGCEGAKGPGGGNSMALGRGAGGIVSFGGGPRVSRPRALRVLAASGSPARRCRHW